MFAAVEAVEDEVRSRAASDGGAAALSRVPSAAGRPADESQRTPLLPTTRYPPATYPTKVTVHICLLISCASLLCAGAPPCILWLQGLGFASVGLVAHALGGVCAFRPGSMGEVAQQRAFWAQNTIPVRIARAKLKWVARRSTPVQPLPL